MTGIGPVLALAILLETADLCRFATSCRCVRSQHCSNGKRQGAGNPKNGNTYLSRVCVEAAHVAIRCDPAVRRLHQRQTARTAEVVAPEAVAHKLARARYHILRDRVPFQVSLACAA